MNHRKSNDIGSSWVLNPNHKIEEIEAEFDESADGYEQSSKDWNYRGAEDGAAFFIQLVEPTARVVDVGCGSGLVGRELAKAGFSALCGCDISASMLEIAHEKAVYSCGLHKADIRAIPFANNAFDAMICIAVLTYSNDLEQNFREFERVIRPGGTIVFSHRVDLERKHGFSEALARRIDACTWRKRAVTEPQLYYPEKRDYTDKITIRYHAYDLTG